MNKTKQLIINPLTDEEIQSVKLTNLRHWVEHYIKTFPNFTVYPNKFTDVEWSNLLKSSGFLISDE